MRMIASDIERVSRVRDLLGRETVPSQLLGSVIADGFDSRHSGVAGLTRRHFKTSQKILGALSTLMRRAPQLLLDLELTQIGKQRRF